MSAHHLSRKALWLGALLLLSLLPSPAVEFHGYEVPRAQQDIRALQPEGVTLTLTLPKTRYYLGEPIVGTLTGQDRNGPPHEIWFGPSCTGDPRADGLYVYVQDAQGTLLPLPEFWTPFPLEIPCDWSPRSRAENFNGFTTPIAINDFRLFKEPGTYTAFAAVNVQRPPVQPYEREPNAVTDPITIEIVPRPPGIEEELIQRAHPLLTRERPEKPGPEADLIRQLGYLQTPEVTDMLIEFCDSNFAQEASRALLSTTDPRFTESRLLAALREDRVHCDNGLVKLFQRIHQRTEEELRKQWGEAGAYPYFKDAILAGPGRDSAAYRAYLLTVLLHEGEGTPEEYAELAAVQLQLSPEEVRRAIYTSVVRREEFLPLLRQQAAFPHYMEQAINALKTRWPEELRALAIEDVKRIHTEGRPYDELDSNPPRLSRELAPGPIPELTAFFLSELDAPNQKYGQLLELIHKHGEPSLLPRLQRLFAERLENKRFRHSNSENIKNLLRFWAAHDRPGAIAAIGELVREGSHTVWIIQEVFGKDADTPELRALTLWALDQGGDGSQSAYAIIRLSRLGTREDLPAVLAAYHRLPGIRPGGSWAFPISETAYALLASPHWTVPEAEVPALRGRLSKYQLATLDKQ
jgi:hypothetical protein